MIRCVAVFLVMLISGSSIYGQVDDICSEVGLTPSFDSPFAHVPYVFGRITLKGFESGAKSPNVTVKLVNSQQNINRVNVGRSGNYCFKTRNSGGTLIVEIDGIEAAQRSLPAFGAAQQREDFEIFAAQPKNQTPPGVISAKFAHPVNPKTIELYQKNIEAESKKDNQKSIEYLKQIVSIDPADFIAWAKLGTIYFENKKFTDAVSFFRKSLELRVEYSPAWMYVGLIRMEEKQFEAAIEIFKHAATLEPTSARVYQLLGESYLQARKGSLGAQALNEAIKLDPVGMAECHLQLAHLYELAGAKKLAAREYKLFLSKNPNHTDRKKIEKYIKDNPE